MTKAKPAKRPERTGATRVGKDEMNLAEFPIAILAHRAPKASRRYAFGISTVSLPSPAATPWACPPPSTPT